MTANSAAAMSRWGNIRGCILKKQYAACEPIRWGMIGCGSVTEVKSAPAYQQTQGFTLTTVMGRNAAKVKDYAQRHGIAHYVTDADALIHDPNVDAVYIATPPDSHREYALKVAAAGKPCCVEKPLAPRYADSLAMVEAFQQANVPLFVAYYRRSLPRFKQVKQWLMSGKIGTVRHLHWAYTRTPSALDLSREYNWRTDATIAPAGYFDDLASHGLDLFTYLLGEIRHAQGISRNQQNLYTAQDAISACWLHDNGVTGSGSWHFGCHARHDQVDIHGSQGRIQFAVFNDTALQLDNEDGTQHLFVENPAHVQRFHVENMREHLLGNAIHPSTGQTALHTSWVMERILTTPLGYGKQT